MKKTTNESLQLATDRVRMKKQTLDARMQELMKAQAKVAVARREYEAAVAYQKTFDTPPLEMFTDKHWSGQ